MTKPTVLFVCVKNGGKSQMAAGLMRKIAGETVAVYSAGTAPGNALNDLSAQSLLEIGVDITAEHPKLIDPAPGARGRSRCDAGPGGPCRPGSGYPVRELGHR